MSTFTRLPEATAFPNGAPYSPTWFKFSPGGTYLVAIEYKSICVYKRSGVGFTKLSSQPVLPSGMWAGKAIFSPDEVHLFISLSDSPYLAVYKIDNDVFTQISAVPSLPNWFSSYMTISPDGTYFVYTTNSPPYLFMYKRNGDVYTKLSNPTTSITATGQGLVFSPDSIYLVMTLQGSSTLTVYKRDGDTFTKLSNPPTLPATGSYVEGYDVAFSPDGTYLAVGTYTTPYVVIYKRNGDTFTKLDNPDVLPGAPVYNLTFSPDGTYLTVIFNATPYGLVYIRDGDTFKKLSDSPVFPQVAANNGNSEVQFTSDSKYLAIGAVSVYLVIYTTGTNNPGPFFLFLKPDDTCYAYQTNTMQQIASAWSTLTGSDKDKNFQTSGVSQLPPITALQTLSKFKVLQSPVPKSPPSYNITAVPKDQFIYALGDIDLSNCSSIDWFHSNDGVANFEVGGGKIRHLASRDGGQTWWTYDGANWIQVLDTTKAADGAFVDSRFVPSTDALSRIISQGMTKAQFDAAPWQAWTIDVGYKAIRFGFGLSMVASTDTAFCDNVKYQYDGPCSWKVAVNGVDYEARFGNTTLKLKWLTDGWKAKVNY